MNDKDNARYTVQPGLRLLIGATAVVAPGLHLASDVLEWRGGFSPVQLALTYLGFVPMPALFVGLYAMQRPRIHWTGLAGALCYGLAFVYFAFTALYALQEQIPDYAQLLACLGVLYTFHGALMVVGGAMFGVASLRTGVWPRWTLALFLAGIVLNVLFALNPVPDIPQTLGSTLRNLGIMCIVARYNEWMNARLYAAAAKLSAQKFLADRNAFFGSLRRHTTRPR